MKNNEKISAAAKLISLGVVDEEVGASLIQQAHVFAARAANEHNLRDYRSAMDLILSLTRLEQDERHKLLDKVLPDQQMLTLSANGQPVSPEQLWQTMFIGKTVPPVAALTAPNENGNDDENETDIEG
jgi:hypothetical protein